MVALMVFGVMGRKEWLRILGVAWALMLENDDTASMSTTIRRYPRVYGFRENFMSRSVIEELK